MIDAIFEPQVGDIRRAWQLGRKRGSNARLQKYIFVACPECGGKRWVSLSYFRKSKNKGMCQRCIGKTRSKSCWEKGKKVDKDGYIKLKIYPEDFFYPMATHSGYVLEHRLVMAKHLGRCLHPWEIVHHRNNIRNDNRLKNLQLVTDERHKQITILENKIGDLEKRITVLEAENALLRTNLQRE